MLSPQQIQQIISANESLRIQLADANAMLAAREQEIELLGAVVAEAAALRSTMEGNLDEIESIRSRLGEKQQDVAGATAREKALQTELTGMALLNKEYAELLQDYAYLQSKYKDAELQLAASKTALLEQEQYTRRISELESLLQNSLVERESLYERIRVLEAQRFLKEI